MLETLISFISETDTVPDFCKNVTSLKQSENSTDRYLDKIAFQLSRMNLQVERLSEHILYLPDLEGVKDLSLKSSHKVNELRITKECLEPLQQVLSNDIIVSKIIDTPDKLLKTMKKSVWDVLFNIRPLYLAEAPINRNPDLIPMLFQEDKTYYVGWVMCSDLSRIFNCEYNNLWFPNTEEFSKSSFSYNNSDDTIFIQAERSFNMEGEIILSKNEISNGTKKKLCINNEIFTIRIPPGGKSGKIIRIPGKGLTNPLNKQRGDLYLKLINAQIVLPKKINVTRGITQESLGVETLGGAMTLIIPSNTSLPTEKSEIFSTAIDGQNNVEIHVLKGNHDIAANNQNLGLVRLNGIPLAPKGVPKIKVTFAINENGTLFVSAKDLGTDNEISITFDPES